MQTIEEKHFIASSSKSIEIPYYPAYSIERRTDGVTVHWFERSFSQVTYGYRPERGRNACVLIVLLTASKLAHHMKASKEETKTTYIIIKCFAEAILEGINEYSKLMDENKLNSLNLTVPEAYKALEGLIGNVHEWKSYVYAVNMADNLHNLLLEGIYAWNLTSLAKKHLLFVILITDSRAVLLVIDQIVDSVTFIDSHPHTTNHGACIASARLSDLKPFCRWICQLFKDLYNSSLNCFELSYFQVKQH